MEFELELIARLLIILFFLSLALGMRVLGRKTGLFYTLPEEPPILKVVSFKNVFIAFFLFLSMQFIFFPVWTFAFLSLLAGKLLQPESFRTLPDIVRGWLTLGALTVSAFSVIAYIYSLKPEKRRYILGECSVRNMAFGALMWLFAYPWVMLINHVFGIVERMAGPFPPVDQLAVHFMKSVMNFPVLFYCAILAVVVLVPIAEEILFRGLLQRWLGKYLGVRNRILLTASIFSLFHFSPSQQLLNIPLLGSLVILACFLGYIYERQQSLWAPIALHMTFNMVSVIMLILVGETHDPISN